MIPLYNHQFLCFFMILLSNQHNWSNHIGCALCTRCFFNHESWIIQSWNLVLCVIFLIVSGWNPDIQHMRHLRCRKWSSSSEFGLNSCQASWWNENTNARVITYMHIYMYAHVYAQTSVYMHIHHYASVYFLFIRICVIFTVYGICMCMCAYV